MGKKVKYADLMKEVERLHNKHYKAIPKSIERYAIKHPITKDEMINRPIEKARLDYKTLEEITTCEGWQIDRVYFLDYKCYKNGAVKLNNIFMAYERWFNPTLNKVVLYGKYVGMFASNRRIPFCTTWWTFMGGQAHKNPYPQNTYTGGYYISPDSWYNGWRSEVFPRMRILPFFEKRGITKDFVLSFCNKSFADTDKIMKGLMVNNPILETIVKTKDSALFKMVDSDKRIEEYWKTILVAKRHGFQLTADNIASYLDYLDALKFLKKDLHNPTIVAPTNFADAHFTAITTMAKRKDKAERNARMATIVEQEIDAMAKMSKKTEEKYAKRVCKYFDLDLKSENLTYHILRSVRDVFEEGISMSHCVFRMKYYEKENSLLFSARNKDNERVETIEINTKNWSIVQSRAYKDGTSLYHKEIIDYMNKSMGLLRNCNRRVAVA